MEWKDLLKVFGIVFRYFIRSNCQSLSTKKHLVFTEFIEYFFTLLQTEQIGAPVAGFFLTSSFTFSL